MSAPFRRAAVLGSGVMGSSIAAHLANAGIPSLVLDIVPKQLSPADEAAGLGLDDRRVRDRIARDAVDALLKARPARLFSPARRALIEVGNLEDDLSRLGEADWVIEIVREDLDIKRKVFATVAPHIAPHAVLSSNTSGLSLAAMAEVLPAELRPRFLGTHFFNPPRYMKLLELIPTADTDRAVLERVAAFASLRLGKGVVEARDTPNFIANRIGVHALMSTMAVMRELELSIEEVDTLTGPALARPKTATFRLADLVGLDTLLHVADNMHANATDDEARNLFAVPDFLRKMVGQGLLGRKSGAGFYKLVKKPTKAILTLDLESLDYRAGIKPGYAELESLKEIPDPAKRLGQLLAGKGKASIAAWKLLAPTLVYSAWRLGEICGEASAIDRAIRWGFNWDLGPFELWDRLGFRATYNRLKADGHALPDWVTAMYAGGAESLYVTGDGVTEVPSGEGDSRVPVPTDPRSVSLQVLRRAGGEVRKNPGASLIDLGDGVLCLEFHSKMNAIGLDSISMMTTAVDTAEAEFQALVIANQGEAFSAGANLMLLLLAAQEGDWDEIDMIVRAFQTATSRLERSTVPVVTAPHGLTLGGGCEVAMAGSAIRASAEAYIGLVEMGAGVIPAGGGCLRLYKRNLARLTDGEAAYAALKHTFETIGLAKVSTSAEEARDLGFLRPQDEWSMHPDHVIADARDLALALARAGWSPRPAETLPVLGRNGYALLDSVLFNMVEAGHASEHDRTIGRHLARVLSGGDVPGPTKVSEQHLLDLERECFLKLCGEPKSVERMGAILKTGKPLRN